eukprot:543671-Amphidinium_carterae.1
MLGTHDGSWTQIGFLKCTLALWVAEVVRAKTQPCSSSWAKPGKSTVDAQSPHHTEIPEKAPILKTHSYSSYSFCFVIRQVAVSTRHSANSRGQHGALAQLYFSRRVAVELIDYRNHNYPTKSVSTESH